ncbi:hypothetical protein [Aquimarina celericrescens]|uniref:Protein SirB1 N-terminal domain-containing protein n=1 Tax=Aquimarina celericrescens TaxID=1964542 RepID=A0ABW5AWF7_9FLAO|nr:hypothetical protein [Aquimarina celericrescens]
MRKIIGILLLVGITATAQDRETLYKEALVSLNEMLADTTKIDFKKAVMLVENAYLHGTLDTLAFTDEIDRLTKFTESIYKNRSLLYKEQDSLLVKKQAVLFSVLKDTIPYYNETGKYQHIPFTYDFEDIWGRKNWENMFVSKLLQTRKGNCHSLPYLYKILAQELGTNAYLALAPNHVYIKNQNRKDGWYNTELTSGQFPNDAWLMASGYIHLDAVVNKLYMEALSDKQSIAMCLVDLAEGYNRAFPANDGAFPQLACEMALKAYPHYINGRILRAETLKKILEQKIQQEGGEFNTRIRENEEYKEAFLAMQHEYATIHHAGYRRMPEEMYLKWLNALQAEQEKYINKEITNRNKSN